MHLDKATGSSQTHFPQSSNTETSKNSKLSEDVNLIAQKSLTPNLDEGNGCPIPRQNVTDVKVAATASLGGGLGFAFISVGALTNAPWAIWCGGATMLATAG